MASASYGIWSDSLDVSNEQRLLFKAVGRTTQMVDVKSEWVCEYNTVWSWKVKSARCFLPHQANAVGLLGA